MYRNKQNIETYNLESDVECDEVLEVNSKNKNIKFLHNTIRNENKNLDELKILLESLNDDLDCIVSSKT